MGAEAKATMANENPLCGRLQQKFAGRGISVAANNSRVQTGARGAATEGSRVNTAESKIRRAADPFEDKAEYVRAGAEYNARTRSFSVPGAQAQRQRTADVSGAGARRRVAAYEKTTPFSSGAYADAYRRAAEIRARAYDGAEAKASRERTEAAVAKTATPPFFSREGIKAFFAGRSDEVRVEGNHISKGLVISIVLFAVVIMMIIFSFSQINEFKREISGLEGQKTELQDKIEKLSVDIDLKNDVRAIEKVATENIGMVKSNQVESRYISVSEGERVELVNDTANGGDESDWGIFTTMLSSVSGGWDKLLEYID